MKKKTLIIIGISIILLIGIILLLRSINNQNTAVTSENTQKISELSNTEKEIYSSEIQLILDFADKFSFINISETSAEQLVAFSHQNEIGSITSIDCLGTVDYYENNKLINTWNIFLHAENGTFSADVSQDDGVIYSITFNNRIYYTKTTSDMKSPSNSTHSSDDDIYNTESQDNNNSNIIENSNTTIIELDKDLNLTYDENGAFLMTVDDIYTWTGHGTMVEGTILRGTIKSGDTVQILGMDENVKTTTITRVEQSRKEISEGKIGETVTVLLSDYHRNEIFKGQVLAQKNSILVSNNIQVSIKMYNNQDTTTLENISNLYSYFRNIDVPCQISSSTSQDNNIVNVLLENSVALEKGMQFPIKNGDTAIAECTIIDIFQ